jgi:hypothetical protein
MTQFSVSLKQNISRIYVARKFITVSTTARNLCLSWAIYRQSTSSNYISNIHFNIII